MEENGSADHRSYFGLAGQPDLGDQQFTCTHLLVDQFSVSARPMIRARRHAASAPGTVDPSGVMPTYSSLSDAQHVGGEMFRRFRLGPSESSDS